MQEQKIVQHITNWLNEYLSSSPLEGFIVGISGGIDSALTSTLCAKTGKKTIVLSMPLHQREDQLQRAHDHISWLTTNFSNVRSIEIDLTASFETLRTTFPEPVKNHALSMANTRARLRMLTLYAIGQTENCLVTGTGNKIEDFGVGFFTKYGDGGVDISPIADLTKSQVFALAKSVGIISSIQQAKPTDGLWEIEQTDEDQLGATYPELEWAMNFLHEHHSSGLQLSDRQREVLSIYERFNKANKHKMEAIPVCKIPKDLFQ